MRLLIRQQSPAGLGKEVFSAGASTVGHGSAFQAAACSSTG